MTKTGRKQKRSSKNNRKGGQNWYCRIKKRDSAHDFISSTNKDFRGKSHIYETEWF